MLQYMKCIEMVKGKTLTRHCISTNGKFHRLAFITILKTERNCFKRFVLWRYVFKISPHLFILVKPLHISWNQWIRFVFVVCQWEQNKNQESWGFFIYQIAWQKADGPRWLVCTAAKLCWPQLTHHKSIRLPAHIRLEWRQGAGEWGPLMTIWESVTALTFSRPVAPLVGPKLLGSLLSFVFISQKKNPLAGRWR